MSLYISSELARLGEPEHEHGDPGEPERIVAVDRAYIETHTPTVKDCLVEAGIRLGGLLNEALRE